MTPEQLFSMLNMLALASWILLAALPRVRWIATTLTAVVVPLVFAVVYTVVLATMWTSSNGGFDSLAHVLTLFQSPWILLAGWTHYLAFDLIVGSWEVRDARERGISHWLVVPCLALTFLFGPIGWLGYQGVRTLSARRLKP